jgi:hypothetical protein
MGRPQTIDRDDVTLPANSPSKLQLGGNKLNGAAKVSLKVER